VLLSHDEVVLEQKGVCLSFYLNERRLKDGRPELVLSDERARSGF
jgi:hypothetical protein